MKIGDIVKSYLRAFPNAKNYHGLAKKIAKENPELHKGKDEKTRIDRIRGRIRYYKGQLGDHARKSTGHTKTDYHDHKDRIDLIREESQKKQLERFQERGGPKILIYDIETLPLVGPFWRLWKQNISDDTLWVSEWKLCTWAAKWLFEEEIIADKITPDEIKNEDDSRVLKTLCNLIEQADIIVAHNGIKFDIRIVNARRLKHGLPPMLPFEQIDTYLSAKKAFNLPRYTLKYIAKFLDVEQKQETSGMPMWNKCLNGDEEALQDMLEYNIQDIRVQEEVYLKLRPYIKPHPNLGLYVRDNVFSCHACLSTEIEWKGKYNTYVNSYDTYQCKDCGAVGRSRNTNLNFESKRFLTVSVPK